MGLSDEGREGVKRKLSVDLPEADYARLMSFRQVFDEIMGEEMDLDGYIGVVVSVGLDKMLKDVMPQEAKALWDTVKGMHHLNPEFVSKFVVEALRRGREIKETEEEIKRLKEEYLSYRY